MNGQWTERTPSHRQDNESLVDAVLKTRLRPGQKHAEQESVRATYLALDVRLQSGEYRGFSYFDIDGPVVLDASHTTLTLPFRWGTLVIQGIRLLDLYREILHHSIDILEVVPHGNFDTGDGWVIQEIEVVERA